MPNLNVTYSDMTTTAANLLAGRDNMQTTLTHLTNDVNALVGAGFQTELASGAFHDTFHQFQTGLSQAIDALEGLSSYLTKAADAMQQTDQQLAAGIAG
jgi:WXG100 family type VII secretion target